MQSPSTKKTTKTSRRTARTTTEPTAVQAPPPAPTPAPATGWINGPPSAHQAMAEELRAVAGKVDRLSGDHARFVATIVDALSYELDNGEAFDEDEGYMVESLGRLQACVEAVSVNIAVGAYWWLSPAERARRSVAITRYEAGMTPAKLGKVAR